MAFPMIQFKAKNVTLNDTWTNLVESKLETLAKYIGSESDAKCDVEFEKETGEHHNGGNIHRVEVNLFVHGTLYRAVAVKESFEMAIDEVRSELDNSLRKASDKRDTLVRRGGRKIKDMLRFGR